MLILTYIGTYRVIGRHSMHPSIPHLCTTISYAAAAGLYLISGYVCLGS